MTDEKKLPRGKPLGTRLHPEMYPKLISIIEKDKQDGGDGLSANRITGILNDKKRPEYSGDYNEMTVRTYLKDLVRDNQIKEKVINGRLTLYKMPREKPLQKIIQ
jgi:hypothetical protein